MDAGSAGACAMPFRRREVGREGDPQARRSASRSVRSGVGFHAAEDNLQLGWVDDDPLDASADEIAVWREIRCLSHLLIVAQGLRNRLGNKRLDVGRRDAGDRTCLGLAVLQQRLRDIVAIAHAFLVGVARTHRIAAIVEDPTREHGGRA